MYPFISQSFPITMTYSYQHAPQSPRNDVREQQDAFRSPLTTAGGAFRSPLTIADSYVTCYIPFLQARSKQAQTSSGTSSQLPAVRSSSKLTSFISIRLILIVLWIITLKWGEDTVFKRQVRDCAWDGWESWVGKSCPGQMRESQSKSLSSPRKQTHIMLSSSRILK